MRKRRDWFLIADGAHARVVAAGKIPGAYATVWSAESAAAHRKGRDLVSDKPGRGHESANAAHHAIEPRSDPTLGPKRDFCDMIAGHINAQNAEDAFDRLFLIAPPKIGAMLRTHLDTATRGKLCSELHKDLVKIPDAELAVHLDAMPRG